MFVNQCIYQCVCLYISVYISVYVCISVIGVSEEEVAQVVESSPSSGKVGGLSPAPPGEKICRSVLEQDT